MPTFTVITPAYNRAHVLPNSITSVLNQTFGDFELIVVDDGSTDNTQDVVARFADPRIRYIYQENRGVSAARNRGAAAAQGENLAFLDSDDEVAPTWLERFAEALTKPQVGLVSCGVQISRDGKPPAETYMPSPLGRLFRDQVGLFLSLSFAVRRALFAAVGGYDEALHYSEITELAWRLIDFCIENGWQCAHIDQALGIYHSTLMDGARHPANLARRLASSERILEKHTGRLRQVPPVYATYCSIAGVTAARLGQMAKARRFFFEAVRWNPREPRHTGRLALALLSSFGSRYWRRHYHTTGRADSPVVFTIL